MDPRCFLIAAAGCMFLSSCAGLRPAPAKTSDAQALAQPAAAAATRDESASGLGSTIEEPAHAPPPGLTMIGPIEPSVETPRRIDRSPDTTVAALVRTDGFIGAVKVFAWAPGRVFEVRAAPLRVTTLSLAPGETLVSKAAGDTVRWQIGEVTSGAGGGRQTHVVIKPLQRGLDTNLILTTSRRIYLIDLKSGPVEAYNPAVAWTFGLDEPVSISPSPETAVRDPGPALLRTEPVVLPQGEPDGRYRIEPQGRRARWTPTAVFNDGRRTFITFDPNLQVDEAPALVVIAPDGERQLVNYRQIGGLFVVDRLFDRAELRLGGRRPQVVVLRRLPGAAT